MIAAPAFTALALHALRREAIGRAGMLHRALAVGVFMLVVFQISSVSDNAGGRLFQVINGIGMAYLMLVEIALASRILPEEHRQGTLDLLRVSGADKASLLLGWCAGLFFTILSPLVAILPAYLLAYALGGVGFAQLLGSWLVLLGQAIWIVPACLAATAAMRDTRWAAFAAGMVCVMIMAFGWVLPPPNPALWLRDFGAGAAFMLIFQWNPFMQMSAVNEGGFSFPWLLVCVASGILPAAVCLRVAASGMESGSIEEEAIISPPPAAPAPAVAATPAPAPVPAVPAPVVYPDVRAFRPKGRPEAGNPYRWLFLASQELNVVRRGLWLGLAAFFGITGIPLLSEAGRWIGEMFALIATLLAFCAMASLAGMLADLAIGEIQAGVLPSTATTPSGLAGWWSGLWRTVLDAASFEKILFFLAAFLLLPAFSLGAFASVVFYSMAVASYAFLATWLMLVRRKRSLLLAFSIVLGVWMILVRPLTEASPGLGLFTAVVLLTILVAKARQDIPARVERLAEQEVA